MSACSQKTLQPVIEHNKEKGRKKKEFHVIVAGLPRSGKSTGLNNIFDLKLASRLSPAPVTTKVISRRIENDRISLVVTDTPGLKSANANTDREVLKVIADIGLSKNFLLILTLTVTQNSCITTDYCHILQNLTTIFGKGVWNWCIVLLTFSDVVRETEFLSNDAHQDYQEYLKGHCKELEKALTSVGVKKNVRLFFEYMDSKQFRTESLDGIVAIPVGKTSIVSTERLFPMQPWTHKSSWTDLAFKQIAKVGNNISDVSENRTNLIMIRFEKFLKQLESENYLATPVLDIPSSDAAALAATGAGAAAGALAGAAVGIPLGPIGIGVGALIGLAAGTAITMVGLVAIDETMDVIDEIIDLKKRHSKKH